MTYQRQNENICRNKVEAFGTVRLSILTFSFRHRFLEVSVLTTDISPLASELGLE